MAGDTRDIRINVTVDSDTRGSDQAAQSLQKVDKAADGTEHSLGGLRKESEKLDVQLAKSKTRLRELEQELIRTGDRTTGRGSLRSRVNQERSWLRELERLTKSAAEVGAAGATAFGQAFQAGTSTGSVFPEHMKGALIGGLVAVGAAAAPAIGAIISGAVAGTVVGGGIAGGVIAATNDSRVRSAFHDLTSEFTAEAFGGGAFVEPVVAGLHILRDEFANLNLDETLAKGASSVPILAQGIADLVANTMPGFNDVMDKAEAFTTVFADGLGDTGDALSEFLRSITRSEGSIEGLKAGFMLLNGAIVGTGHVLEWLSERFHDSLVIGAAFTGGMEDIVRGAENVARSTTQVLTFGMVNLDNNHQLSDSFAQMNDNLEDTEKVGYGAGNSMADFIKILREGKDPTESQADAMKKVNDEFERTIDLQAALLTDNIDFEQGLQDLADTLHENGATLDINTDKGRANQRALIDMAKGIRDLRDDQIALKVPVEEANATLEANKQRLIDQAVAAGFSREEIEKLIGSLLRVPVLYGDIAAARTYSQGTAGGEGRKAAGGFVSAGMSYLVGENRAEVFTPRSNGYISPSVGSWAAGMGGGGGGLQWAAPFVYGGSNQFESAMIESIRTAVAARGGTLAVLGLRA